jgi:hypothetical protein
MKPILFFIALSTLTVMGYAQTCCSGGVPLSGNLGLPPESSGTWQLSISYDRNVLKTLLNGSSVLEDDARERITQSFLVQTGYSFNSRWSADFFFSYVEQQRTIRQFRNEDHVSTAGLGDAALLLKYNVFDPLSHDFLLTLASGIKMPTGRSDLRREDGIPLNADLQPGSGSWDGVFWANTIYKFGFRPSMNISSTAIFSLKGTNNQYLGEQSYRFGNEIQWLLSVNDNFLVGTKLLDASIVFRYRKALKDKFNTLEMPNTGGTWVFIAPGIAYNFSPKVAINGSLELPVFSEVQGTQVSPTYRINAGVFIKLNKKNELLNINN